ncbi:MAG: hypothetical protein ACJ75S_02590 [Solirubrobacterales bacterium]
MAAGAEAYLGGADIAASAQPRLSSLDPAGLLEPDVPRGAVLEGDILTVGSRSLVIHPVESKPVAVSLTPNADISREGPASLSAYKAGDEIAVLGDRSDGQFTAVGVAAVFRIKEATLFSRTANILHTSDGKIILTSTTAPRGGVWGNRRVQARPLAQLKAGDQILAMGLVNQQSDVMTASNVGVLGDSKSLLSR